MKPGWYIQRIRNVAKVLGFQSRHLASVIVCAETAKDKQNINTIIPKFFISRILVMIAKL
jgi:hypothetical protein